MADDIDAIQESERIHDELIHKTRYNIPTGTEGICEDCGENSPRLINRRCARCRDSDRPRRNY
jgi:RNA polymerase-binding transcription factor DksA